MLKTGADAGAIFSFSLCAFKKIFAFSHPKPRGASENAAHLQKRGDAGKMRSDASRTIKGEKAENKEKFTRGRKKRKKLCKRS